MDKFKGLRLKWQDDIKLDKGHTLQEVVGKDVGRLCWRKTKI